MKKKLLIVLIPLVLAAAAVGAFFAAEAAAMSRAPDPRAAAAEIVESVLNEAQGSVAESEAGKMLFSTVESHWGYELKGEAVVSRRKAIVPLTLIKLDTEKLEEKLPELAQEYLHYAVEEARLSSDIYNADKSYKAEVLNAAAEYALSNALSDAEIEKIPVELNLIYKDGQWQTEDRDFIRLKLGFNEDYAAMAEKLCDAAVENAQYITKIYKIEESAKAGPVAARENFGVTKDPAVIEELLARPEAQALINGQELVWNKDIDFISPYDIYYYLDETLLVLVWHEEEAQAVGTFSEVFIADGSQFRRKIAGDSYESWVFAPTTKLAAETNAVLASGADLYHHGRNCGIVVIERETYRYDMTTCDICYIDSEGDMIFSYRNQFSSQEEVDKFVEENDVVFSISFGPVLIDDGKDVTPTEYAWGEINDTYARAALGMLGDKHYLLMNINCRQPNYYFLATLRQAADAMIERGCIKAYALDGGQTATTVFDGKLINPVQFGKERNLSDIIYFATGIPE